MQSFDGFQVGFFLLHYFRISVPLFFNLKWEKSFDNQFGNALFWTQITSWNVYIEIAQDGWTQWLKAPQKFTVTKFIELGYNEVIRKCCNANWYFATIIEQYYFMWKWEYAFRWNSIRLLDTDTEWLGSFVDASDDKLSFNVLDILSWRIHLFCHVNEKQKNIIQSFVLLQILYFFASTKCYTNWKFVNVTNLNIDIIQKMYFFFKTSESPFLLRWFDSNAIFMLNSFMNILQCGKVLIKLFHCIVWANDEGTQTFLGIYLYSLPQSWHECFLMNLYIYKWPSVR